MDVDGENLFNINKIYLQTAKANFLQVQVITLHKLRLQKLETIGRLVKQKEENSRKTVLAKI